MARAGAQLGVVNRVQQLRSVLPAGRSGTCWGQRGMSNSTYPTEAFLANHGWNPRYRAGSILLGNGEVLMLGLVGDEGFSLQNSHVDESGDAECQVLHAGLSQQSWGDVKHLLSLCCRPYTVSSNGAVVLSRLGMGGCAEKGLALLFLLYFCVKGDAPEEVFGGSSEVPCGLWLSNVTEALLNGK